MGKNTEEEIKVNQDYTEEHKEVTNGRQTKTRWHERYAEERKQKIERTKKEEKEITVSGADSI